MKKALKNLLPLAAYWVITLGLFVKWAGEDLKVATFEWVVSIGLFIAGVAIGFIFKLDEIKWGIWILGAQAAVCGIVFLITDNFIIGNIIYYVLYDYDRDNARPLITNILVVLWSAAIIVLPFFIGRDLKKIVGKHK